MGGIFYDTALLRASQKLTFEEKEEYAYIVFRFVSFANLNMLINKLIIT